MKQTNSKINEEHESSSAPTLSSGPTDSFSSSTSRDRTEEETKDMNDGMESEKYNENKDANNFEMSKIYLE